MLRGIFRKKKITEVDIARLFIKAARKEAKKTGAKTVGIRKVY
ncbi:hypothetical protein RGU12_08195 [Fredinandcohnia sp. QZ13]|nr:hypothetical protein [Fredinandcohnia sp. QZ13]MDR4887541.1 hypothetical protein [Fredinandcohnia sp. QZ13]